MKMHSFQIGRMQKDSFSQTKVLFALLRLELSFDILKAAYNSGVSSQNLVKNAMRMKKFVLSCTGSI